MNLTLTVLLAVLALEGAAILALLYTLYRKNGRIEEHTESLDRNVREIAAAVTPGQGDLPWTLVEGADGLKVVAPKAAEHETLYDMSRYSICALRFQLEAEQRERDRAAGQKVQRLRLVFGEEADDSASEAEDDDGPIALAS